jgi:DNA-binding IclR family transcriptional regulator
MSPRPHTVQSVERALDVLEALSAAGEMGVTELARQIGLHVATVHNLLRTLSARQYLLNTGGRYRLGPAAASLASRWDPLQALPDRIQPHLARVSTECGEAASATVLANHEARLIAFQPGTEAITIHFPQWIWPQALKLATGRLLVALGDQQEWDAFITRSPEARPDWSAADWRRELQRLHGLGYCALRTDRDGGQSLIAFPVLSRGGRVVAAVGAACPAFRATAERCKAMTDAVWDAAREISADLGGELGEGPPAIDWDSLPLDRQEDEAPLMPGPAPQGDTP